MISKLLASTALPSMESELLLGHAIGKDRAWIIAHQDEAISEENERVFRRFVERRMSHEPIAYIVGEKEFYGRSFAVDKRVLIPRPSTEILLDQVKAYLGDFKGSRAYPIIEEADTDIVILSSRKPDMDIDPHSPPTIIDIGTGSGCIGITLALEYHDLHIIGTDISSEALDVARENVKHHNVSDRISLMQCDLIPPRTHSSQLTAHSYLIVSNPPYIPTGTPLPPDVANFEPECALFSGIDGMNIIHSILSIAHDDSRCMGVVMELRKEQADKLL